MTNLVRPPFPTVIDSSMMSTFRACPWKAYLEYLEHYKPKPISIHLHAGKAFAAGLEAARLHYYAGGASPDEAVALGCDTLREEYGDTVAPEGSAKSLDRMIGALVFYFEHYPLDGDSARPFKLGDKWTVEFSFAEPLGVAHPETGDPIILAGRADQIVNYAGGTYIEDDKTASQLGASWARQWDLRSQFTHYCWAAQRMGMKVDGVLVRGVSILKTKYETAESVTYRPQWMIDRGITQLERDILRMIEAWRSGAWDMNLDHSCSDFGGCGFRQICLVQEAQPFLDAGFERRRWDPVTRVETVLTH
jgi:hypothetical protein